MTDEALQKKRASTRAWQAAHPEYRSKWRQNNLEKARAAGRESARRHRELYPNEAKEYYRANAASIAEKTRAAKAKDPEKFRNRQKKYLAENRSYYLLRAARARASKDGVPCTITREWIDRRLQLGRCEVTGIPFAFNGNKKAGPWSASLDRLHGSLGYTPDNVRMVVWAYNAAKGHWSDLDVLVLAQAVVASRRSACA